MKKIFYLITIALQVPLLFHARDLSNSELSNRQSRACFYNSSGKKRAKKMSMQLMRHLTLTSLFLLAISCSQNPGQVTAPVSSHPCSRVESDLTIFDATVETKRTEFKKLPENPGDKKWVQAKITHMIDVDQYLRWSVIDWPSGKKYNEAENKCFWESIWPRWKRIDSANTFDLRELMKLYGWFKISEFGEESSHNAWLLVQHADLDRDFQREVLLILEKLYPTGEVLAKDYAYLFDRVTWYADKKPQRYGTQGQCEKPGNWQPHPTEDWDHLDERRSKMGMEPFAENKKRLDEICK